LNLLRLVDPNRNGAFLRVASVQPIAKRGTTRNLSATGLWGAGRDSRPRLGAATAPSASDHRDGDPELHRPDRPGGPESVHGRPVAECARATSGAGGRG
jgi:hypothetical protein